MATFTRLVPDDLRALLTPLLSHHGGATRPAVAQIDAFCEYLERCPVQWEGFRLGPPAAPAALVFTLLLPGSTAIVMIPDPHAPAIDPDAQVEVTRAGLESLRGRRLHYAQALLEPGSGGRRDVLERAGFRHMAPLAYLERDAVYPWTELPAPHEAEWVLYGPTTHDLFADVIQGTYEHTLDCPELSGLRPIEDVFEAHRGSGRHDPRLWAVARVRGEPAGCMLLAWLAHAPCLEVVYMGVRAAWRGRGVGDLLLRWALQQCREQGARRLTLVVDERNGPARRLYERLSFHTVGRRDAYLYVWE